MADLTADQIKTLASLPSDHWDAVLAKLSPTERAQFQNLIIPPPTHGTGGVLDETGKYLNELATGEGPARGEALDYGKKELGGLVSALNPVNVVKSAARMFTQPPVTTGKEFIGGIEKLASGDPEALGGALAIPVTGKVLEGMPDVANKAGTELATNERLQGALNTVGGTAAGAIGAKQIGLSPFIGGLAARNLMKGSDIPQRIGETLESWTGGRKTLPESVKTGLSDADIEDLTKSGLNPAAIERAKAAAMPGYVNPRSGGGLAMSRAIPEPLSEAQVAIAPAAEVVHPPIQVEGPTAARIAAPPAAVRPSQSPVQGAAPASRFRDSPPSATPGFSVEDVQAAGGNPSLNYTKADPAFLKKMTDARASRQGIHIANAELTNLEKQMLQQ